MSDTLQLTIERMSNSADAIATLPDGKICFIKDAVPGDVVEAKLTQNTKSFARAQITKIITPSEHRIAPKVSPQTIMTGCDWAFIDPVMQRVYKRANVVDSLVRIGHFDRTEAEELVGEIRFSDEEWGYRNKLELGYKTTKQGKSLIGMHMPETNDLVKIDTCELLPKQFQKLPKSISGALSYLSNSHNIAFDRIGIRCSKRTKNVEIALWTDPGPFPRAQVAKVLQDSTKTTSVVRVMSKGPLKARKIVGVERLSGQGSWSETIGDFTMKLSAPSFFQVNTKAAEILINLVMEGLDPQEEDVAMDLYCGAGTFTLPLAKRCEYVQAVESYGPAVRDLRRNLEANQIVNVEAIGGDAGREFPEEPADIIVVDPPRAGLAEDVIDQLSEQPARAIAYVSCDQATLARDLRRFIEKGTFKPVSVTPVDLFPQTHHTETVTLLHRQ